jgi:hypothetical protein
MSRKQKPAERISYADACKGAANEAAWQAEVEVSEERIAHEKARAAAFLALASLCERAANIHSGRGGEAHPPWNAALGLIELIAAGYPPNPAIVAPVATVIQRADP